jgi:hypothetical protein
MTEHLNAERLRQLVAADEATFPYIDDVIGKVGQVAPLISCKQVHAVCTGVDAKPRLLRRWSSKEKQRYAIYFWFQVVEPSQHEGLELMMYCRWNPTWAKKGIDYRSKLYKCACVALGRRLDRKDSITTSIFRGKIFRCSLSVVGKPPAEYSAIETIVEKLTS